MERIAFHSSLRYVKLNGSLGNIGLMCNGVGMNAACQDLIAIYGGVPANFLDLGGDSAIEDYDEALSLLEFDVRVKCVLVNVFGGMQKVSVLTKKIISNIKNESFTKPIVIRLRGDDEEYANLILK